jgi:hypothetical protein
MVAKGFRFALGVCLAGALVWGVADTFRAYGRCAAGIDRYGAPPPGSYPFCEWVAANLHRPVQEAG